MYIQIKSVVSLLVGVFCFLFVAQYSNAEELFLLSRDNGKVLTFDSSSNGPVTPARDVSGSATTLTAGGIYGAFVKNSELFTTDETTASLLVFDANDNGNVAPKRTISGPNTGFASPRGLFVSDTEIYIADEADDSIRVFSISDAGDISPTRVIKGANTGFVNPCIVILYRGEIFVLDNGRNLVTVFNQNDDGNVLPKRSFSVSGGLADGRGFWIDADFVYISSSDSNRIVSFPVASSGAVTPTIEISGASTSLDSPYGLVVKDGLIYVSNFAGDDVHVFRTTDNGDVSPLRTIASVSIDAPVQLAMRFSNSAVKSSAVPTLSWWGLLVAMFLLGFMALYTLRLNGAKQ